MFLNPRPMNPYVFVSPDEFLGKAPVDETHFQAGDLHYVRVSADERVCVVRDGEAILLPSDDNQLAKAKQQVAAAIADEKRLHDQAETEFKQAAEWEQRAMLAIQQNEFASTQE